MAHCVIPRRRNQSVVLGAKRTWAEPRSQNRIYEYTQWSETPLRYRCSLRQTMLAITIARLLAISQRGLQAQIWKTP
jgi:hypothetical protein